jgi:hypothetical protein
MRRIGILIIIVMALATSFARAQTLSLVGVSSKICQLNGQFDWVTGAPTAAQTFTNFGMQAADLGAPVDTGGATLYVLFGDTAPFGHVLGDVLPPDDSVGTSTLATPPKSSTCLGLQIATSAPATKTTPPTLARPTVTPVIDQGSFNVPSGGVYDPASSTLYEFFWTNHCSSPGILTPSPSSPIKPPPAVLGGCPETAKRSSIGTNVLAQSTTSGVAFNKVANMPSGFVYVNAVDSTNTPNFASVSQQLGVFITGVPRYRASIPYLAYSATANINDPTKWMFFNGLSGADSVNLGSNPSPPAS